MKVVLSQKKSEGFRKEGLAFPSGQKVDEPW